MLGFGKKDKSEEQTTPKKVTRHISCITDKPLRSKSEDRLSAVNYSKALYKFIIHADTPVTIGVQGGWGSGKTSLISLLGEQLEQDEEHKSLCVFVNAWEHSLFQSADNKSDVALSLLAGLSDGIKEAMEGAQKSGWLETSALKTVTENKAKLINGAIAGIKTGMKIGGAVALQMASNMIGGGDMSKVKLEGKAKEDNEGKDIPSLAKSVHTLRKNLSEMIEAVTKDGKPDRIVFFIDDLDRVSPPTAVEILDITKNIFDIPNCIFVLAIDYEVVVKGLEDKYGVKTAENEREFRQYFDKIIQIPFTMPIGVYASHIHEMLRPALTSLGYSLDEENAQLLNNLANIAYYATNGTPRSIKRIINTLSLLQYISDSHTTSAEPSDSRMKELEIRFIIVALHVSYPEICRRVMENSNFTAWTFSNLENVWKLDRSAEQQNLTAIETSEYFNDEWEKVLYCLCAKTPWLREQARNISQLMNALRETLGAKTSVPLPEEAHALLEDVIAGIRVVSIDTETSMQKIDDSSVKTDRVTVFCQELNKQLHKKYSDAYLVPDPKKYCKKSILLGCRQYEVEISADSPILFTNFNWYKDDGTFQIEMSAPGNWKKQGDAKEYLKKMVGDDFDFEQIGKDFYFYCNIGMDFDSFAMPSVVSQIAEDMFKLYEKTVEAYEELNKK